MPYLSVGEENFNDIKIHYEDHGKGEPLVLIHGYPFSGVAWELEEAHLLANGYRVITYDRRGFGLSSKPSTGHDYDTYAQDLEALMSQLNLRNVTLVGHSMGTGEIIRYLSSYGSERVGRIVLIAPLAPFLLRTDDNETGLDKNIFETITEKIRVDRYAYMTEFLQNFYNTDKNQNISEEKLRADFHLGVSSSPIAFLECVDTWATDFREDLNRINVPCLIIQGDEDRILPLSATGQLLAEKIDAKLVIIPQGSHGITWTHGELISNEIMLFMEETEGKFPPRKESGDETSAYI